MTSDDGGMTRVTGMQRRKRFRRALTAIALAGSAVLAVGCRTQPAGDQPLQLWTLALAPKFNTYMEGVVQSWTADHPKEPVRWTDLPWGSVERKLLAAVFARTAPDVVNLNPPLLPISLAKGD